MYPDIERLGKTYHKCRSGKMYPGAGKCILKVEVESVEMHPKTVDVLLLIMLLLRATTGLHCSEHPQGTCSI